MNESKKGKDKQNEQIVVVVVVVFFKKKNRHQTFIIGKSLNYRIYIFKYGLS